MGKRKKSSKKPQGPKKRESVDTVFTCLYCHHDKSVTCKIDKKEGLAYLQCKVCAQSFQGRVHHLTEPIDVYSMWIDAADEAEKALPSTSSTRRPIRERNDDSEDE
ncbi:Elf1-domain-containing protein [Auricularia subglabra TFB-10046 SS5]|nr:Elf1-domain-containing protein [Auricularia subglabra TFB-10046 SS5]